VFSRLWDENGSGWVLAPFLVGVLVALRVIPAVVRRLMPFSDAIQAVWGERRQLAKRCDSYQWQKLLWIGLGLALYTVLSGQYHTSRITICSVCLVSGALGLASWRSLAARTDCARQPAKPVIKIA